MSERVFYEIADIDDPKADYPYAVIAIYPDRPNARGCVGVVASLHHDRKEAQAAASLLRKPILCEACGSTATEEDLNALGVIACCPERNVNRVAADDFAALPSHKGAE